MPGFATSQKAVWILALAIGLGTLGGASAFTFVYAEGGSYLSDNAESCRNCHIMQDQYDAWSRSSHANVATCNDCHAPHSGAIAKYASKAINGVNHSWKFTTGDYPDTLQITDMNRRIAEDACRYCHQAITETLTTGDKAGDRTSCLRCHQSAGHGS